jgi:hypothetical protein
MGAGQHDDIGVPPLQCHEAGFDLGPYGFPVHRLAAHPGFRQTRQFRRTDQADMTGGSEFADEVAGVIRFIVPGVASTAITPLNVCSAAGLIAGTVPTKGNAKRSLSDGRTSVEAVLQAMTTAAGRCSSMSWPTSETT